MFAQFAPLLASWSRDHKFMGSIDMVVFASLFVGFFDDTLKTSPFCSYNIRHSLLLMYVL
jgi:hypothetical protein